VVTKAYDMFTSGAYVHHYMKYGVEHQQFMDTFTNLEQMIWNYKHLTSYPG
jgi:hypothetical protein